MLARLPHREALVCRRIPVVGKFGPGMEELHSCRLLALTIPASTSPLIAVFFALLRVSATPYWPSSSFQTGRNPCEPPSACPGQEVTFLLGQHHFVERLVNNPEEPCGRSWRSHRFQPPWSIV